MMNNVLKDVIDKGIVIVFIEAIMSWPTLKP